MMGQTLFTALIALFWVAEFAFAAVVVYWFLTQGLSDGEKGSVSGIKPLESKAYTRNSLLMWGGFFLAIVLLIVVGA